MDMPDTMIARTATAASAGFGAKPTLRVGLVAYNWEADTSLALWNLVTYARRTPAIADRVTFIEHCAATPKSLMDEEAQLFFLLKWQETHNFDVVGFSCYIWNIKFVLRAAKAIKELWPQTVVIFGGQQIRGSYVPFVFDRERCADICVCNEAEVTFRDLLNSFLDGSPKLSTVGGIAYMAPDGNTDDFLIFDGSGRVPAGTAYHETAEAALIEDINDIPSPYLGGIELPHGGAFLYEASRGCPYRCFYCHIAPETATHQRSPASVVAEMRRRRDELGVEAFHFIDDIFNFPRPHAKAVLREIAKELPGVRLHFPIGLRADLLDDEILDLFEAAGTVMMALAVETVTPRLQRFIGKYLKIERAHAMIDAASRRFVATTFFMAGFPTETREEAQATIDYAASLEHLCDPTLNIVRIYRGTLLWDHLAPTPDQAAQLTAQTRHATTPRMFTGQPFLFYGDVFDREKVPLTSEDIAELRVDWLRKVQFNPRRILNAHARMRHFFPEAEVVRTFRSWLNDNRFDATKMQRMIDFARTAPPTEVVPPPFARQTAPVKLSA